MELQVPINQVVDRAHHLVDQAAHAADQVAHTKRGRKALKEVNRLERQLERQLEKVSERLPIETPLDRRRHHRSRKHRFEGAGTLVLVVAVGGAVAYAVYRARAAQQDSGPERTWADVSPADTVAAGESATAQGSGTGDA